MVTAEHALVRRAIEEIWNTAQLHIADELFSATYVNHGGLITDLILGPEAIKTSVAFYRQAFPHLYISIDGLEYADGMTVLRWNAHNRPANERSNPDPLGTVTGLAGVTRTREAGGQIQESWTEWDRDAALTRIHFVDGGERTNDVPNGS